MTRAEIRTLVRKMLGETTAAYWTDPELHTYITEGCKDIAFRTKCLRTSGTIDAISCSANTASAKSNEYTISSYFTDLLSINEVYFFQDGENWVKLEPTNRTDLDFTDPGWRDAVGVSVGTATYNYGSLAGIPTKYWYDREEDVLGIYLPPNDDNAGSDYIKVYYTQTHTAMGADTDTPDIPEPLHLAIVDFSVATGFAQRGWGDRANDAWQKYYAKIHDYIVERHREKEDEDIIMKNIYNF